MNEKYFSCVLVMITVIVLFCGCGTMIDDITCVEEKKSYGIEVRENTDSGRWNSDSWNRGRFGK